MFTDNRIYDEDHEQDQGRDDRSRIAKRTSPFLGP
jgi:hypothetical protein